MLSERSDVLTAYSAVPAAAASSYSTSTKVYSRDRGHKSRERSQYVHKAVVLVRRTMSSLTALLVNLFHVITMKLGFETKAHSNFCGSMNVKAHQSEAGHLHVNGETLCSLLMRAARRAAAAGWFVSRKVLSFLWLAIVSPGLWLWGFDTLLAMLPLFSRSSTYTTQSIEDPIPILKPAEDGHAPSTDQKESRREFDVRMKELEKKFGSVAANQNHQMEDYNKLKLLVEDIQKQIGQINDQGRMSALISGLVNEHLGKIKTSVQDPTTEDHSISRNHEARLLHLEALLTKLSEAVAEDRKRAQSNASEGIQDLNLLRSRIESLEQNFEAYKAEFLKDWRPSCDLPDCLLQKVDARVREYVQMMFGSQANLPEALLQWLSANFVSNEDFSARLQELELRLLRNITNYVSLTGKVPTSQTVEETVKGGIAGITEKEARVIVNNALKLYAQDRTGMVDFALESGGGSILGTRCSETYETKTALVSLFGIPLWYLSQSPRVVIQPDMYPGNCWAFKGAQGYLVVRLSMEIFPTAFSLEHIPKSMSPTGNITSAPKDFAVYGLENEYQEGGTLLVQAVYSEDGEPLQVFHVTENNRDSFQIVELRILSNWGHNNYTCLYRFRAHGTPAK
ncbi:unnamed protein product [Ranitomeya imitator]|uniref:SUN domain-containing protein n=1 Tax=Ranitomeya imitator TaxID=111125 RepID=A0ABN9KY52_9NEOB|nr:unnamed protein product [Ranitomeya imitator]